MSRQGRMLHENKPLFIFYVLLFVTLYIYMFVFLLFPKLQSPYLPGKRRRKVCEHDADEAALSMSVYVTTPWNAHASGLSLEFLWFSLKRPEKSTLQKKRRALARFHLWIRNEGRQVLDALKTVP